METFWKAVILVNFFWTYRWWKNLIINFGEFFWDYRAENFDEIIQSQGQGDASEILSANHFVCDKWNKQFLDIESLYQHKAKDHGTFYFCDLCKELEAREATGIGYICCVCDAEFEIATELEDHMSMHDNVLPH